MDKNKSGITGFLSKKMYGKKKLSEKGATGDKSNTKTATKTSTVANPHTQTSTEAYTQGNITVTGGAGAGSTTVHLGGQLPSAKGKTGTSKVGSYKK